MVARTMNETNAMSSSVLIPCYNHARFVDQTLESVFRQTLPPTDLLVIDDGSTDESTSVIRRALERAPFPARLIARENRGLTRTLNQGLAETSGEFFTYLGSDDVWHPRHLEHGIQALVAMPSAPLAYGHCVTIDVEGRIIGTTEGATLPSGWLFEDLLAGRVAVLSPTTVYRRALLDGLRWNEQGRLEDFEMYLSLARRGPFVFVPHVMGAWRLHPANTTWKAEMMIAEVQRTIREACDDAGIPASKTAAFLTAARFMQANLHTDTGQRLRALAMMAQNIAGAPSYRVALARVGRALLPARLRAWRENRARLRASIRLGTVQDLLAADL